MSTEKKIFFVALILSACILGLQIYLHQTPAYILKKTLLNHIGKNMDDVETFYTQKYIDQIKSECSFYTQAEANIFSQSKNKLFIWSLAHPILTSGQWPKVSKSNGNYCSASFLIDDSIDYSVDYFFDSPGNEFAVFDSVSGFAYFLRKHPELLKPSAFEFNF